MKIFNEFGIAPTRTHTAAGYDFYVPNIKLAVEDADFILESFSKSYKKSVDELKSLIDELYLQVSAVKGEEKATGQEMNILLLYLCLESYALKYEYKDDPIEAFVDYYLIFDNDGKPGLKLNLLDHVFINSGVHTALKHTEVGIFFNKSGRGIKGFDVRAQVVDEDYTGCVHLSLAYTKFDDWDGVFYVGDKITQMVVLNVADMEPAEELTKEEYDALMSGSKRGAAGFGSSDEKH